MIDFPSFGPLVNRERNISPRDMDFVSVHRFQITTSSNAVFTAWTEEPDKCVSV
jgi:hypothetical protein